MNKMLGLMLPVWLIACMESYAQTGYKVEGRVVDETLHALPASSVALWTMDSTLVAGVVSDGKGTFHLRNIRGGDYLLKVSMIGYTPSRIFLKGLGKDINLNEIVLKKNTTELKEVTVEGASLVRQVDRMLVYPDKDAVKHSFDPYELISNMSIPGLRADKVLKSIEAENGTVQIRINGVKATKEDYLAIAPKDIVRVEVIDNPGMRYGEDIGTVIDLIVKHRPWGGQVTARAEAQMNELSVFSYLNMKLNYKKSQFGVRYFSNLVDYKKGYAVSDEMFHLDDQDIHRLQSGQDYRYNVFGHWLYLTYNLSSPDSYQLNIQFSNKWKNQPHEDRIMRLYNVGSTDYILGDTRQSERSTSPTLDIYFHKQFRNKQEVQINVIGTMLPAKTNRSYKESQVDGTSLSDIWTDVDADKKSVWTETFYGKTLKHIVLNAGVRHYQMYARNEYTGNNYPTISRMHQMNSSAFFDLKGKWKSVGYLLSLGGTRSYFKESEGHAYYTFTPTVRVNFIPHKNGWLQYSFNIKPNIPSLSSLTNVEQMIDTIQIQRGNPDLMTFRQYTNALTYSYNKGIFSLYTQLQHQYSANPIMEEYFIEKNKLICMEENQDYWQMAQWLTSLGLRNIKAGDWQFNFSVTARLTRYWSKGRLYSYTHNRLFTRVNVDIYYKKFNFWFMYGHGNGNFFGETINRYNNNMAFSLAYNNKNLSIIAYLQNPFKTVRWGYKRLSRIAPMTEWNYNRDVTKALSLSIAYRFEFGRKFKDRNHDSNYSDTDSGILK